MCGRNVLLLTTLILSLQTLPNGAIAKELGIYKCCGVFEMLSGDGKSCVDAPWSLNHSLRFHIFSEHKYGILPRPNSVEWMRHWLPPGLPLDRVRAVFLDGLLRLRYKPVVRAVREAVIREELDQIAQGAAYWRNDRVYFSKIYEGVSRTINNPWPPTNHRKAVHSVLYCVDAARPPLAPFALLSEVNCAYEDCFIKCCYTGEVMADKGDGWMCEKNARGYWSPENSTFSSFVPKDVLFKRGRMSAECLTPHTPSTRTRALPRGNAWEAYLLQHRFHDFFFAFWETCVDVGLQEDGTLGESVFYCEDSQITKGIYRTLRPLSFVSAALTVVALLAVACNRSMRLKAHGWCLACHAVCLLGFNVGQVVYYLTVSGAVDSFSSGQPHYIIKKCLNLALPMYFLLTAANCWLTALCVNLSMGFGKLQIARLGGGKDWKRFLVLSAFAWGLPTLMTAMCAYSYKWDRSSLDWFSPTLVETRTCFDEVYIYKDFMKLLKSGTALFYYVPVGIMIVVNSVCIARTLKKVQFLRKGNSVLRRDDDLLYSHTEEQQLQATKPQSSHVARSAVADAKAIKMYVKMIVMTGALELVLESIFWLTSGQISFPEFYSDSTYAYRATGYMADCFRAGFVVWLAAPDGGYVQALQRWGRGGRKGGRARGKPL